MLAGRIDAPPTEYVAMPKDDKEDAAAQDSDLIHSMETVKFLPDGQPRDGSSAISRIFRLILGRKDSGK